MMCRVLPQYVSYHMYGSMLYRLYARAKALALKPCQAARVGRMGCLAGSVFWFEPAAILELARYTKIMIMRT